MSFKIKTLFKFVFTILLCNRTCSGQNLVPNPSFEEHDTCPNSGSELFYARNWNSYNGTCDYLTKCSTNSQVQIPANIFGYQLSSSLNDSGYLGLYVSPNLKYGNEIGGCSLLAHLAIGKRYYVSLLISPGYYDTHPGWIYNPVCFCDQFGFKFTTDYLMPSSLFDSTLLNNEDNIHEPLIISDTSSWYKFSGSFIADSEYTKLLIGFFHTFPDMTCICSQPEPHIGYYYFDNICVSENPVDCNMKIKSSSPELIVFPNPAKNNITIKYTGDDIEVNVYDMIGQIVYRNHTFTDIEINCTTWSRGIYFVQSGISTTKIILL